MENGSCDPDYAPVRGGLSPERYYLPVCEKHG